MRHNAWVGVLSWWSCQSPVANSCGLLKYQIVSVEECSSLMQNLMQIFCSTRSFWMWQYMCSLSGVYCPHWLGTCAFMHVHSSPFSLAARLHQCHHTGCSHYINKGWTFSGQTSMHCTTCFSFWSRAAYCMSGMLCERQRKVWLSVSKKFAI